MIDAEKVLSSKSDQPCILYLFSKAWLFKTSICSKLKQSVSSY